VKKNTETFCHAILGLKIEKRKALANLVMALSSSAYQDSVTSLSLSRVYHYQYSSIADSINAFWSSSDYDTEAALSVGKLGLQDELLGLKSAYFAKPFEKFYLLNTDTTGIIRRHSPTLPDRGYVYVPNQQVKGNRPVDVGYDYSVIGLSARRPLYSGVEPPWNLPLSVRRLGTDEVRGTVTAQQVNDLLKSELTPLHDSLVVNALDRQYGTPEYIADTYGNENLVNIIRLKNNRVTWKKISKDEQQARRAANSDSRGTDAIYGEKYALKEAEQWDLIPDQRQCFGRKLSKGRQVLVELRAWDDMMIRTKRKKNMKDKPFRLVRVRLLDADSGAAIYKRPMWLGVWGKRGEELDLEEIYWSYNNRFDIEHYFRFGKQRLLMDDFQTPDVEHQDNWMEIVALAYFLLWAAEQEAKPCLHKWQKYDTNYQQRVEHELPTSPSEVQRQLESIILQFEQDPFRPNIKIKSRGRQKGDKQKKRERYKVVYKGKKRKKKKKIAA